MVNSLQPENIGLSTEVLQNLTSYDDFLNFYVQIDQAVNGFSWMKADALMAMETRLGDSSLKEMSKELGENYSTLVSYIRVSRAFPAEKRDIGASFSLHFQASFADRYDHKTKEFSGEERFGWRDKALDQNMSTRSLQREIQEVKEPKSEDPQDDLYRKMGEEIRKDISFLVKGAIRGDEKSQKIMEVIRRMCDEYKQS